MASNDKDLPQQAVRFSSVTQEIEPESALEDVRSLTGAGKECTEPLSPEAQEELRTLSASLQKSRCQARRLENFSFEPVSLPPSRVSQQHCHNYTTMLISTGPVTLSLSLSSISHSLRS